MTVREVELAIHRKNTQLFIEADPSEIILIPKVETRTAGTTSFGDGVPRQSQTFKVIWQADSGIQRQVNSTGGSIRMDFVLVGRHDAVCAIGDYFDDGGNRYVVEWVSPPNGYELKAGGVSHGAHPSL